MQELDDNVLLREYVERDSGEAFAALVARHVNKVYSVALRHTSNPSQAEEITQAVFVILASKAAGLGSRVILSGWLFKTARLTALTYLRSELRRARREQDAHMDTLSTRWRKVIMDADTTKYPGRKVQMSGMIKTDNVSVRLEPRMQAWGWVKGKSKLLATDSMAKDYSLKGTLDWTPFTVACTIPKDTQRIETSFLLWGSGKAWIDLDSVKLEIVK